MIQPRNPGLIGQAGRVARFEVLDGLRGVAALAVLGFHVGRWSDQTWIFNRGYLGVDFFFCLSGFVIAFAYEKKRVGGGLSFRRFLLLRFVRLWPLIVLSMAIGVAYEAIRITAGWTDSSSLADLLPLFLLGILLVPILNLTNVSLGDRLFPLNVPAWSLMLEVWINVLWALWAHWLSTVSLRVIACVAAVSLAIGGLAIGSLDGGAHASTFALGIPRVAYSFVSGILAFRLFRRRGAEPILHHSGLFFACLMLAVLMLPAVRHDALLDLFAVIVVFPIVVLSAASAQPGTFRRIWIFGGDISYPLYILHAPLWFLLSEMWVRTIGDLSLIVSFGICVIVLVISWTALKLYDEPVRRWSVDRWLKAEVSAR